MASSVPSAMSVGTLAKMLRLMSLEGYSAVKLVSRLASFANRTDMAGGFAPGNDPKVLIRGRRAASGTYVGRERVDRMEKKPLNLTRSYARNGIDIIVGTDRVTVKVGIDLDDTEIERLLAFAFKVAERCSKKQVVFRGKVVDTEANGYRTLMVAACGATESIAAS